MSRNISLLSGKKDDKNSLFGKISVSPTDASDSELAAEYNLGVSTVHSTKSFYDFLNEDFQSKKAYVCSGSACLCRGTQDVVSDKLNQKFGEENVGEMICLGRCYENSAFNYNGENYSGDDINKLDQIIAGKHTSPAYTMKSFSNTPFLVEESVFSTYDDFKDLLEVCFATDKDDLIASLKDSGLRGRGGAGFPTGMKWEFCKDQEVSTKYVVCNADEGDPGAFSDRYLMEEQPLKVLFGMVICAYIIGSKQGFLYIRGEYPESITITNDSLAKLRELGLLGDNILGTGFDFDMNVVEGQGAYICGEETALIASIEGRRAEVDVRPPFPVVEGLYKKPTVVNNVESLAAVAAIFKLGSEAYKSIGNGRSLGTKLISLDGYFNNPGLYEVDLGTPISFIIDEIGGGFNDDIKALQIGGPLGGIVPVDILKTLTLDFEAFSEGGFLLGHASFVCIPKSFSAVEYAKHLFAFTAHESCGKCFPCRLGSVRGKEMLESAIEGKQKFSEELIYDLLETMEVGSLCALGGGLPLAIKNLLEHCGDEFQPMMEK
ncbi:formate dehydrogenase [Candidatus Thioglobus sp.]|jgi:NADH-quinone oxidoreductase subunit F|uniref:NADH-ubiquinone oxidoreductase-F iron-sulfur binding region domain-containing protein n=1 Tax=Candidatus Pseudothioglobus sp. Uisw_050_01 TaxID=3230997 RepID=UPI00233BC394|nr:formate dehydrogenase [Candidatus Thioglobus sp.]MDB9938643.1 formate dehydrogenase [Candidatus Thioglobus sp.]MDC1318382.1 formate dehydrogenase [Candidatus Thioglobus sp.]MDC1418011.1 formate dehydrogenase [Candidatus Thioglobus sp.]